MYTIKPEAYEPAAVDWFQLSWPKSQEVSYGPFFYEKQLQLAKAGFPLRYDRRYQYAGGSAGGLFAGSSEQGGFVESRGAVSMDCVQMAKGVKGSGKCSRIDLQVTVRLSSPSLSVGREAAYQAKHGKEKCRGKRPAKCPLHGDEGESQTGYMGAPSSDKRCRVYDKGAQMGICEPGVIWRFEFQYRRRYAEKVWQCIRGLGEDQQFIAAQVCGELLNWGIVLDIRGIEPGQVVFGRPEPTDDQKTLAWLRKQVAPSVVRLLGSSVREEAAKLIADWAFMATEA